jgi:uncharacterized protein (DUF488 family)
MRIFTIGHGTRSAEEFVLCLTETGVQTLIDVRRYPGSRRNPQFNSAALQLTLSRAGIEYRHAVELGGRRSDEPGEERFACIRVSAFRSYAARMASQEWQHALEDAMSEPVPSFMCAETAWQKCHRRLIAELLAARGHRVVHLIRPKEREPHRPWDEAETRAGRLYLCGQLVA